MFEKWLSRLVILYGRFSFFKGNHVKKTERATNRDERFSKSSIFSAWSKAKEIKLINCDHCPLADGTQKIWNCPLYRNMIVNDCTAVRKQRLSYGCLGKTHTIKYYKANACNTNGCTKKHNRLLLSENQMNESNHADNVNAKTITQRIQVKISLQIIPFSIQAEHIFYSR